MRVHNDGQRMAMCAAAERKTQAVAVSVAIATLLTATLLLLFLAGPARAGTTGDQPRLSEYPVIIDTNQKTAPATDGATVVWGENTADGWGIYAVCMDKARAGQVALADASRVALVAGQPSHLAVCGDSVAWQLGDGATGSVWLGDTCGDDPVCVSTRGVEPALAEGVIVWVDFAKDAAGDIVAATTEDPATVVPVCADAGAQGSPAVSHQLVVWQDKRNGTWDIYGAKLDGSGRMGGQRPHASARCHQLDPSAEFPICTAAGDQTEPSVSRGVVAWTDARGADTDIWVAWAAAYIGQWPPQTGATCEQPTFKQRTFAVTTAAGDQVHPAVSGGKVYWEDRSAGAGKSDIMGSDLAGGQSFVVSDAAAAQQAPSAGDGTVVWLDGRAGPAGDVYAAEASSLSGGGDQPGVPKWIDQKVLTLFLSVFQQLGVFTEVSYSTDGGETYSDWQAIADVAEVPLPGEGVYHVALKFQDANGKEYGPLQFTVHVDTHAPCAAAAGATIVRRGRTARIKFRISDNMSPKAGVAIAIRNARGAVVKGLDVSAAAVGSRQAASFVCTLPRGVYRYSVTARDLAGNLQKRPGHGMLIVR